jgi:hypothetical protein
MKHSWREKLDEKGLKLVELNANLRRVNPLQNMDYEEITRWLNQVKTVLKAFPELDDKRKAKLDPKFIPLFLSAHPEIELDVDKLRYLFEHEELEMLRAEELELMQQITFWLEADQTNRLKAYETVAGIIVLIKELFSGGFLTKQFADQTPKQFELFWAIAKQLDWAAEMLRGNVTEAPGRHNVELANLVNAILEHQKSELTQIELYEALKAAGAQLPENPEAFRLWLHRARKQGLVKNSGKAT